MRTLASRLGLVVLLLISTNVRAACGDDPGDTTAVADARAEIGNTCDCAGAPSHASYVACAREIVSTRIDHGQLPPACRSTVTRCATRTTCGRPGAVTCCRVMARGARCSVKSGAERCTGVGGCIGAVPSCCEACGPTGCATTTTTLPGPACGAPQYPSCGGTCPAGERCVPFVICDGCGVGVPPVTNCVCASDAQACGDFDPNGLFNCGAGPCPSNGVCLLDPFAGFCGCAVP